MAGKSLKMKLALADVILKAKDGDVIQWNLPGKVIQLKVTVRKVEKLWSKSSELSPDTYYQHVIDMQHFREL